MRCFENLMRFNHAIIMLNECDLVSVGVWIIEPKSVERIFFYKSSSLLWLLTRRNCFKKQRQEAAVQLFAIKQHSLVEITCITISCCISCIHQFNLKGFHSISLKSLALLKLLIFFFVDFFCLLFFLCKAMHERAFIKVLEVEREGDGEISVSIKLKG